MFNIKIVSENGNTLNFTPDENLVITEIDGLTSNSVSISTSQSFGQTGTTILGTSTEDKIITIDGVILGASSDLRKKLIDTIIPEIDVKIIFDNKFFIFGTPQISPDIGRARYNPEFQFSIHTPYPYWRALEQSTTALVRNEPKFSFPINYGVPITHIFGERIQEAFQNVYNFGNVPVPFVLKFFAVTALSNPQIQRLDTLEYIRIEKDMQPGETIAIDMMDSPMKVTSQMGETVEDAFGYFDVDSSIFKLQAGDNLIKYDADVNKEGLNCFLYYYFTTAGAYGDDETYR